VKKNDRGIPLASEFGGNWSLTFVEILTAPDGQHRQMFRAYWLTDQEWVPGGVRAQVFTTVPGGWIRERQAKGRTIRMIDGSEPPCE
jgi:hypothetical protein